MSEAAAGCPKCGGRRVDVATKRMVYEDSRTGLKLEAAVPVHVCAGCGDTWPTDEARATFASLLPAAELKLASRLRRRRVAWRVGQLVASSAHLAILITPIVLKLRGVIGWSWFWVTAPIWGTVIIGMAVVVFVFVAFARSPHH